MTDILSKMMNDKISKERIKGFVGAAEDAGKNIERTSLDLEKLQEKQKKLFQESLIFTNMDFYISILKI